jgi:hypothetical protein
MVCILFNDDILPPWIRRLRMAEFYDWLTSKDVEESDSGLF